jgi:RHS repeat-associated protein
MNVTALVSASGTVAERYVYDAYGKATVYDDDWSTTVAWDDSVKNEVRYGGYRFDAETGLYNVRHRYYHPTLGSWTQRDPIGYAGGMDLHVYARSAPSSALDAYGLKVLVYEQPAYSDMIFPIAAVGAYYIVGASVDCTLTRKVRDCCDTDVGKRVEKGYSEWLVECKYHAGIGFGGKLKLPFIGGIDLQAKGPGIQGEMPSLHVKQKNCTTSDRKYKAALKRISVELGFGLGGSVGVLPAGASADAYFVAMYIMLYTEDDDKTIKCDYGVKGKATAMAYAIWGKSAQTEDGEMGNLFTYTLPDQ